MVNDINDQGNSIVSNFDMKLIGDYVYRSNIFTVYLDQGPFDHVCWLSDSKSVLQTFLFFHLKNCKITVSCYNHGSVKMSSRCNDTKPINVKSPIRTAIRLGLLFTD